MKTLFITATFLIFTVLNLNAQQITPLGLSPAAGCVNTSTKKIVFGIYNKDCFVVKKISEQENNFQNNQELRPYKIKAYPNPFCSEIKISTPFFKDGVNTIRFVDMSGKTVLTKTFNTEQNEEIEIKNINIKPGQYIIIINSQNAKYTLKVVKI